MNRACRFPNTTVTYTVDSLRDHQPEAGQGSPGATGESEPFQPSNCTPSSTTHRDLHHQQLRHRMGGTGGRPNGGGEQQSLHRGRRHGGRRYHRLREHHPGTELTSVPDDAAFGSTLAPGSYVAIFGTNLADPNELANATTGDKVDTHHTAP